MSGLTELDDGRLKFIFEYVMNAMTIKPDKIYKFLEDDKIRQTIIDIFEGIDGLMVFVNVFGAGSMEVYTDFPEVIKGKGFYFIKRDKCIIEKGVDAASMYNLLYVGDMYKSPIVHFHKFVKLVMYPMLMNEKNRADWPDTLSEYVLKDLHKLCKTATIVSAKMEGKTYLAHPVSLDKMNDFDVTHCRGDDVIGSLMYSIETTVINWTSQIAEVLEQDSGQVLNQGKFPGPLEEQRFWKKRLTNMYDIYTQMTEPKAKNMTLLLEKYNSAYAKPYKDTFKKVVRAYVESETIHAFLTPLITHVENIEMQPFEEIKSLIQPLVHIVSLIWVNCEYYRKMERLVVLLIQICNLLIDQSRSSLDPVEILKEEPDEGLKKVEKHLEILYHFRLICDVYRNNVRESCQDQNITPSDWGFHPPWVFSRFTLYTERLELIKEFFKTCVDYNRLEKVDVLGLLGGRLSSELTQLFEQYLEEHKKFLEKNMDCLNPNDEKFSLEIEKFMKNFLEFDNRMSALIIRSSETALNVEGHFKTIFMFGPLIDRQIVKRDYFKYYEMLLNMIHKEIDDCKLVYDQQVSLAIPIIPPGMPSMSGSMNWAKSLKARAMGFINPLSMINSENFDQKSFKLLKLKYEELMALLDGYYNEQLEKFKTSVISKCQINLAKNLLSSSPATNTLEVTFDIELVEALREIKYLKTLGEEENIPDYALSIYDKCDILREYRLKLLQIAMNYNYVKTKSKMVEFPLIAEVVSQFDTSISPAIKSLTWEDDIKSFLDENLMVISDLKKRLVMTQDNFETIKELVGQWKEIPLYLRKERKNDNMLNLDDKENVKANRYNQMKTAGNKITSLIEENKNLFQVNEASMPDWLNYIEYVEDNVIDGLLDTVKCSLSYLVKQTEVSKTDNPLLLAKMMLVGNNFYYTPAMKESLPDSLLDLVDVLVQDIMCQSKQISRIAAHRGAGSFQDHINSCDVLVNLTHELATSVRNTMKLAEEFRVSLQTKYSIFWSEDRKEFIRQFVKFGRLLTKEDFGTSGEIEAVEMPPTLEQFKEQIMKYDITYEEVEKIEDVKIFETWLKVEIKPFKHALLNVIKLWGNEFKVFLYDHVTNTLVNLELFVKESVVELTMSDLDNVTYAELVRVLERLKKVRENEVAIDSCFEPTRDTVLLLREFGEELPEEISKLLEVLPEQWQELKNQAVLTKQAIQQLQEKEIQNIRQKCIQHDENSKNLRSKFLNAEVFNISCEKPYETLDEWNKNITETENGVDEVHESAAIFEVRDIPNYMELKATRRDIRILKQLWDYVNYFNFYVIAWKESQWKNIDFSQIDEIIREVTLEIRTMDKDIKKWSLFQSLEALLKETNASVQAVRDLQDPSVKDRHWKELMIETGQDIKISDETSLAELLSLNLHKFEEEVRGVVSKAANEQKIDKDLEKIRSVWEDLAFEYDTHDRTKIILPKSTEELTQILEETQVKVLDMIGNRDNAFFIDKINYWYSTLSKTDQVISLWFEVQRVWSGLESIFVLSDDIKVQLPEDTKRFFTIDEDFKRLAKGFELVPNVIKSTTGNPNLFKEIEVLRDGLTLCEKALAQYLETKRLAFPRFYFVSAADLMDIVSNGKLPLKVMKHLSKLFDSIEKLKILDETVEEKIASHMIAKDREVMKMSKNISLDGQVEEWLNRLLDQMLLTMRLTLADAVVTYEEKPRDQWLFDYPAQISLTGSQIGWASEVQIAFARLEEGLENAMKDYNKKQINQLGALIQMLLTDLSPNDRQKIMTLCTIDVHNRDVVAKLITQKVDSSQGFLWLSQLRHRWDDSIKDCYVNICDAQFLFAHEYLGNQPRLVITPLTDRCYITLTQSLHLCMSGAPAGPAGTGKTETTKDLGRAMGIMVYVFNCSEQMDYKSIGNIYKGLAQSGSWGCFDEFNRISVEVLSVVAVQVKVIQDAIKMKKEKFNFLGEIIPLNPAVGLFITMNPGYAGRTELPENLKALFRPCAMVVPDFELICEIMLVAEGFLDARLLARKFITLYQLCKELLSKQDHYDWGLRAIKSVLVVAGSLKRADRQMGEDSVLMRALRDFNTPKIVTDDSPVFIGLIGDLFPQLNAPRQRNPTFEADVRVATESLGLQTEDSFILKVVQLQELFNVRHSVFIDGNAGTGKSQVWKSLHSTYKLQKMKPLAVDLNPKAVTNDELFGIINPATREWKDGLFSVIMRDLANLPGEDPKWIVLDGDIDPMWIESLNTVMDDNKILTLASNERIPLTKSMRLLFEISQLKTATPATVSRAGILYINPGDLGWQPFVHSWLDERVKSSKVLSRSERSALSICFDKYIPLCLEAVKTKFKKITPIPDISHIQMLCHLLECLLEQEKQLKSTTELTKEGYEMYFVFCCVWAFGGCLFKDQLVDHRVEFSKWWLNEFKQIKFPSTGGVFDFFFNVKTKKFTSWQGKVAKFELDPEKPLQAVMVPTIEVARISYFLDLLIPTGRPIMLIGSAGTGKSVLLEDKFGNLSDKFIVKKVPFNFYTTSEMLQQVLEKCIEKKAGKNYGPPGQSQLIYFIDDLNMPEVDKFFTVQPHTLIRQHIDYSHWYDRQKLTLKIVHKTQYIAAMNPTSGSFTISPRLQRHFAVFALSFPNDEAVKTIYSTIIRQHFALQKVQSQVARFVDQLAELSVFVHNKVAASFLPTAIKFHYIFNLRDLSNLYQGLLFSTPECIPSQIELVRLWRHEAQRVYCDKMVDLIDLELYMKSVKICIGQIFPELGDGVVHTEPNLFCHFSKGMGEKGYFIVSDYSKLVEILTEALNVYNETFSAMNLVLFENAVFHILRINRILEMPRGNALLIGIGGSGKQSLSKLASYIAGLDVYQLVLRKGFSMNDLKTEMATIYIKTGLKNLPTVFLMTDAQIADEKFLVYINDFLASGEILDLFPDEELDQIINGVRSECKAYGLIDTNENCWKFFIDKVRRNMKIILCFSPVGNTIRVRARRFPALVNCTCIDWFHEWPHNALLSVSRRFLDDIELLSDEVKDSLSEYMAYVHTTVNEVSQQYLAKDRKYNYTTPKSFLEQIDLYKKLLANRDEEIKLKISRLVNGLERLKDASEQTKELKVQLAAQEIVVGEKTQSANELIVVVGSETEKVTAEKEIAAGEESKVAVIKKEVEKKQRECERDLQKAEPALIASQEALNTLNKGNLSELKALGSPPADVVMVGQAVMVLLSMDGKLPRDRSWKAAKAGPMAKVDQFLSSLINYDKENIHPVSKAAALVYAQEPSFQPDIIRGKSLAAAGLCAWVINILRFHDIYCDVKPKRDALDAANEELRVAAEKLEVIQKRIAHLEASLEVLTSQFKAATDEKLRCQEEAEFTAKTLDLANRLVNGFASENVRWANQVNELEELANTVPGDVLITTSFISYFGYFTKFFRLQLLEEKLWPFLKQQKIRIPIRDDIDPLELLVDDAIVATWSNENLPTDRMSVENATILTFCERWPLMVDPQLQAIKWIKTKYGKDLVVIRLNQKGYLDKIEAAIKSGSVVLIENIAEDIDPVLDPVIGRQTIKKGRAIKIGDKEIPYDRNFRLILQTKLANPHYKPELQAQTTLINFTVTRDGLEDQLLAVVVSKERPDLEKLKSDLTTQQNSFKITLKALEDSLLAKLASSGGNFLGDHSLVENLESNKKTAKEIEEKVAEAKITEKQINVAREFYRPNSARASLIYFIMNDLNKINPMYQFSLKAFRIVFEQAIENATEAETEKERSLNLIDSISFSAFTYTTRGLFEQDKLIFTVLIVLQIQLLSKEINQKLVDFLLKYPAIPDLKTPVDFLNDLNWGGIQALAKMTEFRDLDKDIVASAKRWKAFVEIEAPEKEKFPQEWKNKSSFEKLCMMRALRPDRMTYALRHYIATTFGQKYVEGRSIEFAKSFQESGPAVPIFFILSPGVDPLKDVELLGKNIGFSSDKENFHNISLGQGQEIVAEEALDKGADKGHWVVLQNIHLVAKWLATLEKKLEQYSEKSNENYRVFLSAEPAGSPEYHIIPQGILENAIKITNEPPTGMHANLHKALENFSQETLEKCSKEAEFKPILFALCYFHAVVTERRKFGAQGWNRTYPFNVGDLTICVDVLFNYLEANAKVPWEDLRYLFGEIMYGGHITDDWDRTLCRTYLQEYMQPELLEGELMFASGFAVPPNSDYKGYHAYIDEYLPPESPYLYGLHPNAEIEFLSKTSERVFRIVFEMQPRDMDSGAGESASREEVLNSLIDELIDKCPDCFNLQELQSKQPPEERTPYTVVVLQETERMNILITEIKRSLKELKLGLKGELTITNDMEVLGNSLFLDQVPLSWERVAYPSLFTLGLWFADLCVRIKELDAWVQDFSLPGSVWLSGLFNPQSFLTAVMQQTARKNDWPLDRMCINCDVTKKQREEMGMAPREGAYVHGLYIEGARWDPQGGVITDAKLKELAPILPVIFLKAIPVDRQDLRVTYACPVYKTKIRGPTFVWTFNLKTKQKASKWVLGGVALLLQV